MSCLIVESEEENEEEENQTLGGPETLRRWQQNGCVEKTKGRKRLKLPSASWDALIVHLKGLTCW